MFEEGEGYNGLCKKCMAPAVKVAPAKPYDTVAGIMRFEGGEMETPEEVLELLTALRDQGILMHLQGSYGRLAIQYGVL